MLNKFKKLFYKKPTRTISNRTPSPVTNKTRKKVRFSDKDDDIRSPNRSPYTDNNKVLSDCDKCKKIKKNKKIKKCEACKTISDQQDELNVLNYYLKDNDTQTCLPKFADRNNLDDFPCKLTNTIFSTKDELEEFYIEVKKMKKYSGTIQKAANERRKYNQTKRLNIMQIKKNEDKDESVKISSHNTL
jgi:hypothetical protein